jgi:hypothetical protein
MSSDQSLMFVATDVVAGHETEWNRWYDGRHIPQRQALPGFMTARRFEIAKPTSSSQRYLALYDLENPQALETEQYLSLSRQPVQSDEDREMLSYFRNRLRGIMTLISDTAAPSGGRREEAAALLAVGLEPEASYEEEFNAWYEDEHVPYLTNVPGVLGVRRFKAIRDDIPYLALGSLRIWPYMAAKRGEMQPPLPGRKGFSATVSGLSEAPAAPCCRLGPQERLRAGPHE